MIDLFSSAGFQIDVSSAHSGFLAISSIHSADIKSGIKWEFIRSPLWSTKNDNINLIFQNGESEIKISEIQKQI